MSRKGKATPLKKVTAAERYLNGEISQGGAADSIGAGPAALGLCFYLAPANSLCLYPGPPHPGGLINKS